MMQLTEAALTVVLLASLAGNSWAGEPKTSTCETYERCSLVCPKGAKQVKEVKIVKFSGDRLPLVWCEKDGQKHGPEVGFSPSGKKFADSTWKKGKAHGKSIMWFENGRKYVEQTFKNGKQHGKMTEWFKDGRKRTESCWKKDKEVPCRK
jgi:hypothetical protein